MTDKEKLKPVPNPKTGKEPIGVVVSSAYTLYSDEWDDPQYIKSIPPGPSAYPLYQKMFLTDSIISSSVEIRKSYTLSAEASVAPYEDSDEARRAADFAEKALSYAPDFQSAMSHLLDALVFGYSFVEIVWDMIEDPDYGLIWVPVEFINHPPNAFNYDLISQQWMVNTERGMRRLPPGKFLYLIHNGGPDRPMGYSVLEPLRLVWLVKRWTIRFWSEFNERFASPALIGYIDDASFNNETFRRKMLNMLTIMRGMAATVLPESAKVDPLQVGTSGTIDAFSKLLDFCDNYISRTVLGSTLTTTEAKFGTRAQAEVHERTTYALVSKDAENLARVVTEQLLKYIIMYNMPDTPVPSYDIVVKPGVNTEELANTLSQVVRIGLRVPQSQIRELLGLSPPEEDEEILPGVPPLEAGI